LDFQQCCCLYIVVFHLSYFMHIDDNGMQLAAVISGTGAC